MLDAKILENYYLILLSKLQTGADRITASKYKNIKNDDFQTIIKKFNDYTYHFIRYEKRVIGKRTIFSPCIRDKIVLRFLTDKLQQKYEVKFTSRDVIISQLKELLSENISYSIFRIDIKAFYDSIRAKDVFTKLSQSSLLSSQEYNLVKQALKGFKKGLPQGLSISAILSEITMENIDFQLKRLDNSQIYYARYVDDIIIILHGKANKKKESELCNSITNIIKRYNLQLNIEKTQLISDFSKGTDCSFEYLGYKFFHKKDSKTLYIGITSSKILKQKNEIKKAFVDYKVNHNIDLLFALSCNV